MKAPIKFIVTAAISIVSCSAIAHAQIASNPPYTLDQSVIATGGGTSDGGVNNIYKVEGTGGQSFAGTQSGNENYSIRGGFWSSSPLAPTAAHASLSGRVVGVEGTGLGNVVVTLTGGTLTVPRTARTNPFGNFKFEDIEIGQVYVISVKNKKYGFIQDSFIIMPMEDLTEIVFQASWEN